MEKGRGRAKTRGNKWKNRQCHHLLRSLKSRFFNCTIAEPSRAQSTNIKVPLGSLITAISPFSVVPRRLYIRTYLSLSFCHWKCQGTRYQTRPQDTQDELVAENKGRAGRFRRGFRGRGPPPQQVVTGHTEPKIKLFYPRDRTLRILGRRVGFRLRACRLHVFYPRAAAPLAPPAPGRADRPRDSYYPRAAFQLFSLRPFPSSTRWCPIVLSSLPADRCLSLSIRRSPT